MNTRLVGWVIVGLACWHGFSQTGLSQDEIKQEIRKTVDEAHKSLQKKDLKGFLGFVDVPWFHDRVKIIKDREELEGKLGKAMFGEDFKLDKARMIIGKITSYKEAHKQFSLKTQQMLDNMLKENDWVVEVQIAIPGRNNPEGLWWMVSRRGEKFKLVGVLD